MLLTLYLALSTLWIDTAHESIELKVSVAKTNKEHVIGLQNAKSIGLYEGMLFIFDKEGYYPFWMKDTEIPLALIFINAKNEIIDLKYGVPFSKKNIVGRLPYQYILETNPKLVSKYQIKIGNKMRFHK